MKKLFSLLFCILFISVIAFADEITDLLDKAKVQYNNNDTEAVLKTIDSIKGKLKKEKTFTNSDDSLEVGFNRLKLTPEKYVGKALTIKGVAIASSGFEKMDSFNKSNEYGVVVRNLIMNDSFSAYLSEGKMVFVMEDTLVDKLLDEIPVGYSYYYNIWTEPVYTYSYRITTYSPERICYIAKIVKLEAVKYNKYTEEKIDTGEFIEN